MSYSMQHRTESSYPAWSSLSRGTKMSYWPADVTQVLRACQEEAWVVHFRAHGREDLLAPDAVTPASPTSKQEAVLRAASANAMPSAASEKSKNSETAERSMQSVKLEPGKPQPTAAPIDPSITAIAPRELERILVKGSVYRPFTKELCDLAQLVRGLVATFRLWAKNNWSSRIALVNGGNEQYAHLLDRQLQASLLFTIVYSSTHWALLVIFRPADGPPEACLYDGRACAVCRDMATAFLCHVETSAWLQGSSRSNISNHSKPLAARMVRAETALQSDAWSCGHRVVITADHVLAALSQDGHLPVKISGPTDEEVSQLLRTAARCEKAKLEQNTQKVKLEPRMPGSSSQVPPMLPPEPEHPKRRDGDDGVDEEEATDATFSKLTDVLTSSSAPSSDAPTNPTTPKRRKTNACFMDRSGSKSEAEPLTPPAVSPLVHKVRRQAARKQPHPQDAEGKKEAPASKRPKLSADGCPAPQLKALSCHLYFQRCAAAAATASKLRSNIENSRSSTRIRAWWP